MQIPRYWTRASYTGTTRDGQTFTREAYGWSAVSLQDAQAMAQKRARDAVVNWPPADEQQRDYDYQDIPPREPVLEEITCDDAVVGLITRNRYGALVLNSAQVLFADIDFPPPPTVGLVESLRRLFGRSSQPDYRTQALDAARATIEQWHAGNKQAGYRLYETHSGVRMLMTHACFDPLGAETFALFDALGCDALYQRLTRTQACFRARLTPKPWRCGLKRPVVGYPFVNETCEKSFLAWENKYNQATATRATCRLLQEAGPGPANAAIARIVEVHDLWTLQDGRLLA